MTAGECSCADTLMLAGTVECPDGGCADKDGDWATPPSLVGDCHADRSSRFQTWSVWHLLLQYPSWILQLAQCTGGMTFHPCHALRSTFFQRMSLRRCREFQPFDISMTSRQVTQQRQKDFCNNIYSRPTILQLWSIADVRTSSTCAVANAQTFSRWCLDGNEADYIAAT